MAIRVPAPLGRKLIERRCALLLTPYDLAEAAGVTAQTVYRLERGWMKGQSVRIRRTTLVALLNALGVTLEEFRAWATAQEPQAEPHTGPPAN